MELSVFEAVVPVEPGVGVVGREHEADPVGLVGDGSRKLERCPRRGFGRARPDERLADPVGNLRAVAVTLLDAPEGPTARVRTARAGSWRRSRGLLGRLERLGDREPRSLFTDEIAEDPDERSPLLGSEFLTRILEHQVRGDEPVLEQCQPPCRLARPSATLEAPSW